MILFARVNPDTPGKLAMHAYAYEHMELAAYELLRRIAERAGDEPVRAMAEQIGGQERAMADRIAAMWDRAVEASLREKDADDIGKDLVKYLRDAHALEAQAMQLLETGPRIAGFDALAEVFASTSSRPRSIAARRSAAGRPRRGAGRFQAGAMRAGALNLGTFFKAQPDTPVKLAGFAYAFEALEVGAYELLTRVAQRAGDEQTAGVAQRILADERFAAERIAGTWDAAVEAGLAETVWPG